MLAIAFRFPSGRVHATPWGRHVNEGEVEWPPSPWRVCRALLATGTARAGWTPGDPPAVARELLQTLGAERPIWWLPTGVLGHTRHYMPVKGKTTKVLDVWVRIPREQPAVGVWDVELSDEGLAILDELLGRLGWLGRAESWVTARRTDEIPEGSGYHRCAWGEPASVAGAHAVHGYHLMDPDAYRQWREVAIEGRERLRLEERQAEDVRKGRSPRASLTRSDRDRIVASYPVDPVDALALQTTTLRKEGWSDPPGARRAVCWRPPEVLAPPRRPTPRRPQTLAPTFALLAVTPDTEKAATYTRLGSAVLRADLLHRTLVQREQVPEFTGHGCSGHQHAHLLPLALGSDATPRARLPFAGIDHVLIWAPGGLTPRAEAALNRPLELFGHKLPRQLLSCVGFSVDASGVASECPVARSSRVWASRTPYVPPRHLKRSGRSSLDGQVREGLRSRGLPEPELVEVETADGWYPAEEWWARRATSRGAPWWRHFQIDRGAARRRTDPPVPKPPQRVILGLRVRFREPVGGPLCLGFGSHFGLGQFYPDE